MFGGNSFTPVLTSGGIDPSGDGWLRLTDNANNRATYAYYDTAVTSANRTVFTSFDYASYNGTGADGITFFLFDGASTFSEGAFGGSMGYAPKTIAGGGEVDKEGLAGGYLAISLDDFGNFSNPTEGRTGGPGSRPNAVAVRGPGDGYDGYEFIAGTGDGTTAALTQQLDFPTYTTRPDQTGADYRHVEILITPTNQLTVWLQFGDAGALQKVLEADLSGYLRPETLKFGFTSGTGGSTEIHELRALTVATLVANLWDNGANGGSSATGDWATAVNWNPDVPATGDDILFDNTFVSVDQTVNVGTGTTRTIRSIQIDAPFSYTLNNGTLNFDDVGLPGFLGIAVTQTNGVSATGNTINSAITASANTTIRNATTSALTLTGNIANGGNTLTFDGAGNTTASGVISGSGGLVKDQTGNLTLSNTNTYSGGSTVLGGTITVDNNSALGTGDVTLNGGGLAGTGSRTIANTVTLAGDGGIANLTLSNKITQNGGDHTLTLDGGTLAAVDLSNNATNRTLTANVTGDSSITGIIANGGTSTASGLTKTGAATLTLSGANTYTGTTTIDAGTLQLGANNVISDSSDITINSGNLDLNGKSEKVDVLKFTDGATIDFGSAAGNNSFVFSNLDAASTGVLTINNYVGPDSTDFAGAGDFLGTTTASLGATLLNQIYFAGYGAGSLENSTLTDAGNGLGNAYRIAPNAPAYSVWDGLRDNGSASADANWGTARNWVGDSTPTFNSSARLSFGTSTVPANRQTADMNGNRTVNAIRFEDVGIGFTLTGTTGGDNETLTFAGTLPSLIQLSSSDQSLIMDRISWSANGVIDVTGAGNLTLGNGATTDGELYGSGNITKLGTGGRLILNANNTNWTGNLTISQGIVEARYSGNALGSTTGTTSVAAGSALQLNTGGLTFGEAISLAGTGTDGTGALRNIATSGTNTVTGALTLTANTTITADSGGTLALSGGIGGAAKNLSVGGAGNTTISGAITTTTGTVTKDGAGTLTFGGTTSANTYTGLTTVNEGTLVFAKNAGVNAIAGNLVIGDGTGTDTVRLDASNQITNTATVTLNNGGVLNLNGNAETIAGVSSASSGAQIQLGAGTLTVNNSTANTYAGTLTGGGSLTKTGVGRLTLSGSSGSYTGATNVNSGIVALGSATALGTGTVNVASSGNVEIQGNSTVANAFSIQGDGTGANDGAIENFSGNNTLSGNVTLADNARIGSSSGTLTLSNAGTLAGTNRNLTVSGAGNTVVNRNVDIGTGTLTKEGSGNLALNTANTYTGATTITGGKITAGVAGIFSDSTALTVGNTAVYDMAGFNETVGNLQGTGTVNFNNASLTLASGASSFGGDFGFSNGTIVVNSGATLTLDASFNAANINIVLNGGTLFLGNGLNHTFGNLTVTGSSIIDFGTSGSTVAQFDNVNVTGGGLLAVNNWTDMVDYFLAVNSPGAQGTSPTNKVVFNGFAGADTRWIPYTGKGELSPVPEPSAYGVLMLGMAGALFFVRRRPRN